MISQVCKVVIISLLSTLGTRLRHNKEVNHIPEHELYMMYLKEKVEEIQKSLEICLKI